MRADRKKPCVVWQEKMVCVCCAVCPSDAPERLGLRVLRLRGCRGEKKQQKVGWSMTMVWPSSAPSQMRLVGVLETREHVYCEKIKCRCPAPERFRTGSGRVGTSAECTVLCGEKKKSTGVGPPSASSRKWAGRGTGLSCWCSYGKKCRSCSMFQELVSMLPSESFNL
jgi:hypothetical protein